jgi:ubiquinone/menaquinone biosynthesis C-methylase UbiE
MSKSPGTLQSSPALFNYTARSAMATAAINQWHDSECARAFWKQHELPPYRRLLTDTVAWLDPKSNERWLDLGCGCGQLTRALWHKGQGQLDEIVGLDCAGVNDEAYRQFASTLQPPPANHIRFVSADFSKGLPDLEDEHFDGVVSGLAIPYAESFDEDAGQWTTAAYDRVLTEVARVLRPGGRFIFSANVPDPCWFWVAVYSLTGLFRGNPFRFLKNAWRIWAYGSWLKAESFRGRFNYLAADAIREKLIKSGFEAID